jgi:hypothetical protein
MVKRMCNILLREGAVSMTDVKTSDADSQLLLLWWLLVEQL